MKFTISRETLHASLAIAQQVAARRSTMPVLANVLLRSDGMNRLQVCATDLTVYLVDELECKAKGEGALTLNAKQLAEVVAAVADDDMVFEFTPDLKAIIRAGKAKFQMVGLSAKDFPAPPVPTSKKFIDVPTTMLAALLDNTMYAASPDEARLSLAGVNVTTDNGVFTGMASDGHRAVIYDAQCEAAKERMGGLVPKKAAGDLARALTGDSVRVAFGEGHMFVKIGARQLAVAVIDAEFPGLRHFLRNTHEREVVCRREALIGMFKRVGIFARTLDKQAFAGVALTLHKGAMTIDAEMAGAGTGQDEMEVDYDGGKFCIGVDARFFAECLSNLDTDEVRICFGGELEPIEVHPVGMNGIVAIVMPVRL